LELSVTCQTRQNRWLERQDLGENCRLMTEREGGSRRKIRFRPPCCRSAPSPTHSMTLHN